MNLKPIVAVVAEVRPDHVLEAARTGGTTVAQALRPGHHGAPGGTA